MKFKSVITTSKVCARERCSKESEITFAKTAHYLPCEGDVGLCWEDWEKICREDEAEELRRIEEREKKTLGKGKKCSYPTFSYRRKRDGGSEKKQRSERRKG